MTFPLKKNAARGDMLMRLMSHAGEKIMPRSISAFRGNTGGVGLKDVVGELRKARSLNIPLGELRPSRFSAQRLAQMPQSPAQVAQSNLAAMPKLNQFQPLLDPRTSALMSGRLGYGAKASGFISRLQEHGFTQKQAEAFLKRAISAGDVGNFAWELSGIPSVGRGVSDYGSSLNMLGHGDLWGATKRFGSGTGNLAMGLLGWIPGIGWAGKGMQAAALGMKGFRGAGAIARGLNLAGRGAQAFGGYNLVGRTGALAKGVGRGVGRLGPEFSGMAGGLERFGQNWSNIATAGPRAPLATGAPATGIQRMNPLKPDFWSSRAQAFGNAGRGVASPEQLRYARYAGRSLPMNVAAIGAPAIFPGAGGPSDNIDPRLLAGAY